MDFVLSRYHNADYVFGMSIGDFFELWKEGHQKQQEDKMYQQWLVYIQHAEEPMTFEQFLGKESEEEQGIYIDQIGF